MFVVRVIWQNVNSNDKIWNQIKGIGCEVCYNVR
jgi:hypothetical protein